MRLTVNALKRLLGMGLAIALVATAPTALAANDDGQDGDVDKPDFTLYAVADPINTLWALTTTGRVTIDGRSARLSDEAAHGSRIVVDDKSVARAIIHGVGRITISPRSEVVLDMIDDTVVAHMAQGSMQVEIAPKFTSYVETHDSRLISRPGSLVSYRVKADPHSGTTVDRATGEVDVLAVANDDGWDIDTIDEDNDYHVDARKSRNIKIRVENNGSPVPNQAVTFAITQALNGASGGFTDNVQRITTTTDGDGSAEVELLVGAAQGTLHVEAFVPGTDAHKVMYIYVDAKEKTFWNPATTSLYVALGAGAVAGTVLAIKNRGRGDDNIPRVTPQPPVISAKPR